MDDVSLLMICSTADLSDLVTAVSDLVDQNTRKVYILIEKGLPARIQHQSYWLVRRSNRDAEISIKRVTDYQKLTLARFYNYVQKKFPNLFDRNDNDKKRNI